MGWLLVVFGLCCVYMNDSSFECMTGGAARVL